MLSKDEILNAEDTKVETVDVPEWGGQVKVKCMTGSERDEFETSIIGKDGERNMSNIRAKLLIYTIIDDDGNRMFTTADVKALGDKSAAALDRVFDVAKRLSKIGEDDIEELEKK